jgi:uncharacterized membrane protein
MRVRRFFRSIFHRRSLMQGLAAGLFALAAVWFVPSALRPSSRMIIAWDLGLIVFFVSLFAVMRGETPEGLRVWSAKLQASRRTVLLVAAATAAWALLTVFVEMKLAKADHGLMQGLRVAMVILTVALSWLFVQTAFALDYAHEFFDRDQAGGDRGGLAFPGGEAPDFWDFLHFAVIIGAAAQTADISLTSKAMRRLVTVHSLIAFSFNAVILALAINLTAGLL